MSGSLFRNIFYFLPEQVIFNNCIKKFFFVQKFLSSARFLVFVDIFVVQYCAPLICILRHRSIIQIASITSKQAISRESSLKGKVRTEISLYYPVNQLFFLLISLAKQHILIRRSMVLSIPLQ